MSDAFVCRTTDVTLSDVVVEGCLFVVSGALESVIGVEKCDSELARGTIRLHRVGFRKNRFFDGAVAIQANASSCSKLEIEDFDFHENTCNGVCGLLLARENRLQSITIEHNRPMLSFNEIFGLLLAEENRIQNLSVEHYRSILSLSSRSLIIWAPPQSSTSGDKISAYENNCTIFGVEGGSFSLSNSNFTQNSASAEGDDSISACIQLNDASASIRDCSFEENEASYGVAINARRSNITLKDSLFQSNVAQMKGTIFLRNRGSLTIDSCRFSSNRAEKSGGAVDAQKTELSVTRLSCVQNNAGLVGGCLHVDMLSSLKMSDSVLEGNRARSGGALFFRNVSAEIVNSSVLSNHADNHGGGVRSVGSLIIANELTADGNRANGGSGGSISMTSESTLTVHDSVFKNSTGFKGGAVRQSENSVGTFDNVTFVSNVANWAGGSFHMKNSTLIVHNSRFRGGTDSSQRYTFLVGGGFLFAADNSSVFMKHATMTNGSAPYGGAIELRKSVFEAKDLNVSFCRATHSGGGIDLSESIFKARDLNVSNCTATSDGGAVNARYSKFLCTDCLFASNTVLLSNGGAISVSRLLSRGSFIQLQRSRITNNSARFGGESTDLMP